MVISSKMDRRPTGTASPDRLARKGLKLIHLRLVLALDQTGQVSAAATRLNITQPAASRLLGQIEQIVGVELYNRHPRGIELSQYGRLLAQKARRILRDLDDTDREIAELGAGLRGQVNIGAVTGPAFEIVLPVIRQQRVTHPAISVAVSVETSGKLVDALLDGTLDFFLGRILGDTDPAQFDIRHIGEERLSLIVRAGHPLTRRSSVSLRDCIAYDWVLQTREGLMARTMEHYLADAGLSPPRHILRTSSLLMTLAMVERSNAIAPIVTSVADFYGVHQAEGARIAALPLTQEFRVSPYALVRQREHRLSPASRVFYDAIARQSGCAP